MSTSAAVASNSTMMIERRKVDDMSESLAENSPNTTARYGNPLGQRWVPQIAPPLYRVDGAHGRGSGGREFGIWQQAQNQIHQGKTAARQRSYSQQFDYAHQWETNRQGDQQLDIAAAYPSALVYDYQQQQQDCRSDQRFGNLHRAGKLTSDPE